MISSKRSQLIECVATSRGVVWGEGRECGALSDQGFFTVQATGRMPSEPVWLEPVLPAEFEKLASWASALRNSMVSAWAGAADEVAVRVVSALVSDIDEGGRQQNRRLRTAQFLLGPDLAAPVWTRTIPFSDPDRPWPSPVLQAIARASAELTLEEVEPPSFDIDPVDGPWIVDLFPAADLVRFEATRWLRAGLDLGTDVGSEAVSLEDPGEFGAALDALDANGDPQRPIAAVLQGRLTGLPNDGTHGGLASGSLRQGSWREPPVLEWRSIRWTSPMGIGNWPSEGWVITRALFLRSALLVSGHRRAGGSSVARWGPKLGLAPAWWLSRVGSALPDAAPDATGWPVVVPPFCLTRLVNRG